MRVEIIGFSRSREKGDSGAKDRAKRTQVQLDDYRRRRTSHKKRAIRISRRDRHRVPTHARYILGGGEVRHHSDRLLERSRPVARDTNAIALLGDNQEWVSLSVEFISVN